MSRLPNRYDDPLDDEDEIDIDEWMEMSDEEQDRELDTAMRQLSETYARLTPLQRYRGARRNALRLCIGWRQKLRDGFIPELSREYLRKAQIRLVKLRIERATGSYPGEA